MTIDPGQLAQLPCAIDAEQSVLGALMLDVNALARIDWLGESDFYREDHRAIFRAIKTLNEAGRPCDAVTMGDWFDEHGYSELVGGSSYVIQLANATPSAASIVAYAEIVREKSMLRTLIDAGTALIGGATGRGANATDLVAAATQALSHVASSTSRGGLVPAKVGMKLLYAEMMRRYREKAPLLGLPTPWHEFNTVTKGLRKGELYIIAGRPNMGKSIVGVQLAVFSALRGLRVGLFSVEMTEQQCLARAVAAHGNIPFDWVEQPNDECEDSEMYWARYSSITQAIIESPLLIDATPGITITQLLARATREQQRKPFDLIVIDHIHDMEVDPRAELRRELGKIAQGCKTFAKQYDCPVVALAQLKRTDKNAKPTLTDLRESGEIEQKGDVIFFVHREEFYNRESHMRGIVELIPGKGRNIRVDKSIFLTNNSSHMRFDDRDGPLPDAPPMSKHGRTAPLRGYMDS